jgi:hypothetical protein
MELFYTGNLLFGHQWSLEKRKRLAGRLGSACHIFELKALPAASSSAADRIENAMR